MKQNNNFKLYIYYTSAVLAFMAAVMPEKFDIPIFMRPWIFITAMAWMVVISSGIFTS